MKFIENTESRLTQMQNANENYGIEKMIRFVLGFSFCFRKNLTTLQISFGLW